MRLAGRIDALAIRLPEADPLKADLRRRITALANECGCTMGGVFLALAAILAVAHFVTVAQLSLGSGLRAFSFVFGASLLGKAVGLAVAWIRLLWLGRVVAARLASVQVNGVHLH